MELPALMAGQLWQGSLLLPAAGRDNFLSPLRALLGDLNLVSHQTLCLVCGEPQPEQIRSPWSYFLTSLPANTLFLTHQYLESVVGQRRKVDIILKFVVFWLCLCFSSAFRGVLWVCVSFHTFVDLARFAPPFFLCGVPVWSDSL